MDAKPPPECVVCLMPIAADPAFQSCSIHHICQDDLNTLFERAAKTELDYPPKCCHHSRGIDIDDAVKFYDDWGVVNPNFVKHYKAKVAEYGTPIPERVYCSNKKCSTFLADDRTVCHRCGHKTCRECKEAEANTSAGHECGAGKTDDKIEYTSNNRVKRCPKCSVLIQLTDACNHMTCGICAHEFCFVCLEAWDRDAHRDRGCTYYSDPTYDAEGYDSRGIHRDTGLDKDGYNISGYNRQGFDRRGNQRPVPLYPRLISLGSRVIEDFLWTFGPVPPNEAVSDLDLEGVRIHDSVRPQQTLRESINRFIASFAAVGLQDIEFATIANRHLDAGEDIERTVHYIRRDVILAINTETRNDSVVNEQGQHVHGAGVERRQTEAFARIERQVRRMGHIEEERPRTNGLRAGPDLHIIRERHALNMIEQDMLSITSPTGGEDDPDNLLPPLPRDGHDAPPRGALHRLRRLGHDGLEGDLDEMRQHIGQLENFFEDRVRRQAQALTPADRRLLDEWNNNRIRIHTRHRDRPVEPLPEIQQRRARTVGIYLGPYALPRLNEAEQPQAAQTETDNFPTLLQEDDIAGTMPDAQVDMMYGEPLSHRLARFEPQQLQTIRTQIERDIAELQNVRQDRFQPDPLGELHAQIGRTAAHTDRLDQAINDARATLHRHRARLQQTTQEEEMGLNEYDQATNHARDMLHRYPVRHMAQEEETGLHEHGQAAINDTRPMPGREQPRLREQNQATNDTRSISQMIQDQLRGMRRDEQRLEQQLQDVRAGRAGTTADGPHNPFRQRVGMGMLWDRVRPPGYEELRSPFTPTNTIRQRQREAARPEDTAAAREPATRSQEEGSSAPERTQRRTRAARNARPEQSGDQQPEEMPSRYRRLRTHNRTG
ncbi:uncharacterized protein K452DRAFT_334489 [Aplosporella prunicola CBS 121167]|uniref:RBR-type E3 ubiquitin transferase n=1 Tax=Aplosporella prunicola CBS 121167 TaxID=1176127 RepID=A0A6A6B9M9_9PEZI|nr:uncharacterized protein K452DRAFT_334489 [Aplosporella prunicola CBS 121167]KAF2140972.1 hypothetical protein K452DRAFT_334489 [Aplosporella prunicola CBS 121167]